MKDRPSELFITAIRRGYDQEVASGNVVRPSAIWDQIVAWAFPQIGMFRELFEWDHSRAVSKNRIETIMDVIGDGCVPGLRLSLNEKGRFDVVEE